MESAVSKVATGIQGLDEVLQGGVLPTHSILISGGPGSGKTTLGMHFLVEETEGESLFVTLGETADQLRKNAARLHLALDGVEVLDLSPGGAEEDGDTYSLLESWDVEGTAIHDQIVKRARELQPARIFIDSVSHMRYLSSDTFQYRKQVMSMLRKLTSTGATVLFTSEQTRKTKH